MSVITIEVFCYMRLKSLQQLLNPSKNIVASSIYNSFYNKSLDRHAETTNHQRVCKRILLLNPAYCY